MPVDGDHHLLARDAELVGGGVDDAAVGLVRHEPVDVGGGDAGVVETGLDDVGDHADGVLEHFPALHAQMADRPGGRRAAVDVEFGAMAAVGAQLAEMITPREVERAVARRPPPARSRRRRRRTARRSCGRSSRACAKMSRRRSPARACASRSARNLSAVAPRRRSPSTPPADRTRRRGDAECGLDLGRDGGKGVVGRRGGDDDEVDVGGAAARRARARRRPRARRASRSSRRRRRCGAG